MNTVTIHNYNQITEKSYMHMKNNQAHHTRNIQEMGQLKLTLITESLIKSSSANSSNSDEA